MKVQIEYDTKRSNEVHVVLDGASALLARDHNMNWRTDGFWVANSSATTLEAVRCLIHSMLPANER